MPYRRLGSSDRLSTTVRDSAGALVDPGDIVLKLRDPAKVVSTLDYNPGPIVRDGLGQFHYDVANLTTLGPYGWFWKTTGTGQGVAESIRYFTLVDEWTPVLLSLSEAKSFTNTSAPDPDIELYVDSVTEWLEKQLGPIVPVKVATKAAVVAECGDLYMPTMVVPGSVTAATANGSALDVTGWAVDDQDLRLIRTGTATWRTTAYWQRVMVTYTPGCDPIPTPLKESAGLLIQSSYDNQRGPAGLPLADAQDAGFGSSYPLALQARDKWKPYAAMMA